MSGLAEQRKIVRDLAEKKRRINQAMRLATGRGANSELERRRLDTEAAQEIGPLPDPENWPRRESCRFDMRLFALTYFAATCWRGFAPYQEEMIAAFQDSELTGARVARAVRRGGFKSTLARIAVIHGILYGYRKFPLMIGATEGKSAEHRDNLIEMIASSKILHKDFPELIPLLQKYEYPNKRLRLNGELLLKVTANDRRGVVIFPRLKITGPTGEKIDSDSNESRIAFCSMQTTGVSGLSYQHSGGQVIRPDWLIFDDVQTPQSAKSAILTNARENAIVTTFLGLAKLGQSIPAIMVCTVREEDDLTMRFCDRKRHPDWDGKKFPIMLAEPDGPQAKLHWDNYAEKLHEGITPKAGLALATAYYCEHRKEMDEGGIIVWEQDKDDGYLSCIQWCMTIKFLRPDFFRTELQQQGAKPPGVTIQLDPRQLVKRLSGIPRGIVPARASYLTGFVDSQDELLFWAVVAWRTDMTGWVVDWGAWPEQPRPHFFKSDIPRKISAELPGAAWEEAFVLAHNQLDQRLLGTEWPVEGGGTRGIDLLLKDWSDGQHRPRIESQVMASPFKSRIRPAQGRTVKPGGKPIHLYGDIHRDRTLIGGCWIERRTTQPNHVQVDTNMAKAITCRRLQTVVGAPSALVFPGDDESELTMLIEHLTAERAEVWKINEAEGILYQQIPGRDNDFFDCLVGNTVAASMLGCALAGEVVRDVDTREVIQIPERFLWRRQRA